MLFQWLAVEMVALSAGDRMGEVWRGMKGRRDGMAVRSNTVFILLVSRLSYQIESKRVYTYPNLLIAVGGCRTPSAELMSAGASSRRATASRDKDTVLPVCDLVVCGGS